MEGIRKKWGYAGKLSLLVLYLAVIFYLTLLNREQEPQRMAWLTLFGSYRRAWEESHEFILWGLVDNVIMMMPLGALFPWVNRKLRLLPVVLIAFALTMFIESTQYLTRLGYFDVDDIWNNLWGAVIGYGIFSCLEEWAGARKGKRRLRMLRMAFGVFPLLIFFSFFAAFFLLY